MHIRWIIAPIAAITLALSACGGDQTGPEETPSPSEGQSTETPNTQPSGAPASSEGPSASQPAQPSEPGGETSVATSSSEKPRELGEKGRAVIDDFLSKHEDAQQVPVSAFDVEKARKTRDQMKVEPAKCADVMNIQEDPELLKQAAMSAASTTGQNAGSILGVSVAELPTGAATLVEQSRAVTQECPQFTVGSSDQSQGARMTTTAKMRLIESSSVKGADASYLVELAVQISGHTRVVYSAYAAKGNLFIAVSDMSVTSSPSPAQAEKALTEAVAAAQ